MAYRELLDRCRWAVFTQSPEYIRLLEMTLGLKAHFLEVEGGAIPYFSKKGKYGEVCNSLPFYGSHGSVVVDSALASGDRKVIARELYEKYNNYVKDRGISAFTMIENPFLPEFFYGTYTDPRRCQITLLPRDPEDVLRTTVEKRMRASIKRPIRHGVRSEHSEDFSPLYSLHKENMESIGAKAKPWKFYQSIESSGADYSLTYAYNSDGEIIAGLLLFYYRDMVEYYTPATSVEHRKEQGLCYLIYSAMTKAIEDGYRYWNWGGTWLSGQDGVYRFKRGWGAEDYFYSYHTLLNNKDILTSSADELLSEYPFFYVLPFPELKKND